MSFLTFAESIEILFNSVLVLIRYYLSKRQLMRTMQETTLPNTLNNDLSEIEIRNINANH